MASTTVEKEGWLIKKGKRRYFVLSKNGMLTWFTHHLGSVKGCLELKDYVIEKQTNAMGGKEILLDPIIKNSDKKTYTLESKEDQDVEQWSEAMEKVRKFSFLDKSKELWKQGWLEKKGKKRWFLLKNEVLYWFNKEQFVEADFKKDANGSLELFECEVSEGPDTKQPKHSTTFNFTVVSKSKGTYVMTAKTINDLKDWITLLKQAVTKSQTALFQRHTSLRNLNQAEKKGYLIKKNQRRFYVLKDGFLSWYLSETSEKQKGKMNLVHCIITTQNIAKKNTFIVQDLITGKTYEITSEMTKEYEDWIILLQKSQEFAKKRQKNFAEDVNINWAQPGSLTKNDSQSTIEPSQSIIVSPNGVSTIQTKQDFNEKRGWLQKKGQKRFFILQDGVLMWWGQEQTDKPKYNLARGLITLQGCIVEKNFHEFSFSVKTSTAKVYILTARTSNEADEWVEALKLGVKFSAPAKPSGSVISQNILTSKTGWMEKKGKLRWFVLADDILKWYETDIPTAKLKGSLTLAGCVLKDVDKMSFAILSPSERNYTLMAKNDTDKVSWARALQYCIFQANELLESGVERRGWLEKKGQRRFFVFARLTLMWFTQQPAFEDTVEENANNSLNVQHYKIYFAKEDERVFILEHPQDKKRFYELTAPTKKEAHDWVRALTRRSIIKTVGSPVGKVFGAPLSSMKTPQDKIPPPVRAMLDYLIANAVNVQGIFRISGSVDKMLVLKEKFDSGEIPDLKAFSDESSIHAVAGLLKMYFRDLPVPLFPTDMYKPLLFTADNAKIRDLIHTMPVANQDLAKELFIFLNKIAANSNVNQMNDTNLAIVFGPNLLRKDAKTTTTIASLTDTPVIINLVSNLITNYTYYFN